MWPRKLWPVLATALASGFAQEIALALCIKVTSNEIAAGCAGRLLNHVRISDPDWSLRLQCRISQGNPHESESSRLNVNCVIVAGSHGLRGSCAGGRPGR